MILLFCMQSILIFAEVRQHTTSAIGLLGHFLSLGVY